MDCPSCKATLQTEECADCGANASWIWLGRTRSWLFAACAVLTAGLVYDWLSENARSAPAALPGLAALVVAVLLARSRPWPAAALGVLATVGAAVFGAFLQRHAGLERAVLLYLSVVPALAALRTSYAHSAAGKLDDPAR